MNLNIISAGAGSGKTYRLTHELVALLKGDIRASGIIATTFTNKAAAELQERVRIKLLEEGMFDQADQVSSALIGTVHSLGVRLLRRFAFEMGVSPQVDIIADEDHQIFFNQSLSMVLTEDRVQAIERLVARFNLADGKYEWRSDLRNLIDIARTNGFDADRIRASRDRSIAEFFAYLDPVSDKPAREWDEELARRIEEAIDALSASSDETKTTRTGLETLQGLQWEWKRKKEWSWHHWARIGKLKVSVKSRPLIEELVNFAQDHEAHPHFRQEWKAFVTHLFDLAVEAVAEYDRFKKERGLIDYTDMEVLVSQMLEREDVRSILSEELDLLMVDEFQDTSPIQLDIFLKLSRLVKMAIWVGDPKQSIYGFRGAEPRLMQAIIQHTGGVKPENIQRQSWRSRQQLVHLTNALFTKAFPELPEEQVALDSARATRETEPPEAGTALLHWYVDFDEGKRVPGRAWFSRAIAELLYQRLDEGLMIKPKEETNWRRARPGDVAILCRTNRNAVEMAHALHESGLKASIARAGLMHTAEGKLVNACLRFLLSEEDSLAIAELLLLASDWPLEEIVEDRFDFLEKKDQGIDPGLWGLTDAFIEKIKALRDRQQDLSASETVNLVLDELQLRRIAVQMGKVEQRLANLEEFRRLALQYEDGCQRLHTAASLGGFLLGLARLQEKVEDWQGLGQGEDAVQVMTYHKSKGLEWPVVICHDLDQKLRTSPWGMEVLPESEKINLEQVLANRWIRYWVNPYGRQAARTPITQKLEVSPLMDDQRIQALAEEARLLYVGITRARDYLVLPQKVKQSTLWLNRVWQEGEENLPTLDHQSPESPFEWKGEVLPKETRWAFFGQDIALRTPARETASLLPPPEGRSPHATLYLHENEFFPGRQFRIRECHLSTYAQSPFPAEARSDYPLKKAINAFLTAYQADYSDRVVDEISRQLLTNFQQEESEAPALQHIGKTFFQYLKDQFSPIRDLRKRRVQFQDGDRIFRGIVDLALETEQEWLLVQTAVRDPGSKSLSEAAAGEAGRCWLLSHAWKREHPDKKFRTFVHYPLSCSVAELELEPISFQTTLDL